MFCLLTIKKWGEDSVIALVQEIVSELMFNQLLN